MRNLVLEAAAVRVLMIDDPAMRSGSGVFCRRLAQISGIPSATTNDAFSYIGCKSGVLR